MAKKKRIRKYLPSSSDDNGGRDRRGRFAPGNKAGRGNPYAKQVAELRAALFDAVEPDELREIIRVMLAKAKRGSVPAAKLVLAYLVGLPIKMELLEPAEVEERGKEIERVAEALEVVEKIDVARFDEAGPPERPDERMINEVTALLTLGAPLDAVPRHLGIRPTTLNEFLKRGRAHVEGGKLETPEAKLAGAVDAGLAAWQFSQTQRARRMSDALEQLSRRDPENYGRRRPTEIGDDDANDTDASVERWI